MMAASDLRHLVFQAVGLPVAAVGLSAATAFVKAFGSSLFARFPVTLIPLYLGAMLLILWSVGTIAPPSDSVVTLVPLFASFLVLIFALQPAHQAVERYAFHLRGAATTCEVLEVDERVETSTDSEGHTHYHRYYDHRLTCADPQVREMTTGSPAADPGDQVDVAFDPSGRLHPRPVGNAGDYLATLRTTGVLLAIGIFLNLAARLEWGVKPAHRVIDPVDEWLWGLRNRWRARRRRRRHRRRPRH